LLGAPAAWLLVAYLGSLAALLVTSLYKIDDTGLMVQQISLTNFKEILTEPIYRTVAVRTVAVAAAVTVIDMVLALPAAYFIAKVATARWRALLVAAILVPLWASYLVKAYAWRAILGTPGGVLDSTVGHSPGYSTPSVVLVLAYLWLPYMILPIYAGLERLPDSLVEASGDLGARSTTTFRLVVLPVLLPSIVAGSIFTFSLSLGDYIAVGLVGGSTQMIGSVVYANFSSNLPLAAAFAILPIVIMIVYLLGARRTGAFENL
jgi:putative spermidine/putrescine transport system permease protein